MARNVEEGDILPGRAAAQDTPCRWLVALDYDGTLRREFGPPIPPAFCCLMEAWRPYGVRWGINTGRSLGYLFEDLEAHLAMLPDFICTTERFAYLADNRGQVAPAAAFNRAGYIANARLRTALGPALAEEMQRLHTRHPEWEWVFDPRDPLSVQAKDSETMDAIAAALAGFVAAHEGVSMQRASRYMRLSDARYNKATALAYVMEQWGIDAEHLFAMGDGHNDLDVFRRFPESYFACPADAHADIILWMSEHAGHVSSESGVLEQLQRWFRERVLPEEEKRGIKCQHLSVSA